MSLNPKFIYIFLVSFSFVAAQENIEEIVVTGTLIKDAESDLSPVQVITAKDYENLNITNIGEISKYLSISSGSRFQSNALEGVDQGMSSITLRGLDHSATLLLLNSKRHTFSGTPSNKGDGYIDANIVPEIAIEKIEILKEGATSIYGSDAIAGVINFLTYKDFDGLKVKIGKQKTSNYNQEDVSFGLLYGTNIFNGDLVIGLNSLERSALSASEIPGIAELGWDAGANCTTNDGGFPAYDHAYILVYAGWCCDLFCHKHGAINHSPSLNTWAPRKNKWLIQYTL